MKTLSSPVDSAIDQSGIGVCELYDIYLPSSISTPNGTTDTLRLCTLPGNFLFFTPDAAPEPTGTQGDAATYYHWPLKREPVRAASKSANDKILITASNVSQEWAQMLADVDWQGVAVVIRKVVFTISGATVDDAVTLFAGNVDGAKVTNEFIALGCSNDLAAFGTQLPAENMHTTCRFNWGDDMCGQLPFHANNLKSKTVGSSSTTTLVKSSDLTEDTKARDWISSPGTELVNALADGAITTSSDGAAHSAEPVTFNSSYDFFSFDNAGKTLTVGERVQFAGTGLPGGLAAATWYYVVFSAGGYYKVSATSGGTPINITSNGTAVTLTSEYLYFGYAVKSSNSGYWQFSTAADWGDNNQGYWQIPNAQAGTQNADLKPWIQFDFGSAKTPKLWRIKSVNGSRESLVRLILFFSSSDASTWTFETYFEMPPVADTYFDVFIPAAATKRYWRICVRSRWNETPRFDLLQKVKAYEGFVHYWRGGILKFAANTATALLQNVSRPVLESGSGEVLVPALPVAPANGDTFTIQRGCDRTFNNCCVFRNWENFGGFDSMPFETVVR